MEKIDYINFSVSDGNKNKSLLLNKLNVFYFKDENNLLVNSIKETKVINQVIVEGNDPVEKINNLITGNNVINSIVIRKDDLEKKELDFLRQIKNLKYLILDEKIINEHNMNEGYQFIIIPKKYFAITTDKP